MQEITCYLPANLLDVRLSWRKYGNQWIVCCLFAGQPSF